MIDREEWLDEIKRMDMRDLKTSLKYFVDDQAFRKQAAQLCREETKTPEGSKLKCRYEDFGDAYSKLAPFKLEELASKPKIHMFHNILSHAECYMDEDQITRLQDEVRFHDTLNWYFLLSNSVN